MHSKCSAVVFLQHVKCTVYAECVKVAQPSECASQQEVLFFNDFDVVYFSMEMYSEVSIAKQKEKFNFGSTANLNCDNRLKMYCGKSNATCVHVQVHGVRLMFRR